MAELYLKVNPDANLPGVQDGDVLFAPNDIRIKFVHADGICNVRHFGFNANGLRDANTLPDHMKKNTCEFKFQRVSNKEIKRITLADMSEEILSDVPNAKGEAIDVPLFIQRRLNHARHAIFGTPGAEYWYGGKTTITDATVDPVWTEITAQTGKLESDHRLWPMSRGEGTHLLAIRVTDFSDEMRAVYESRLDQADGQRLYKSACFVPWKDLNFLSDQTKAAIGYKQWYVDIREQGTYEVEQLVQFKGLINNRRRQDVWRIPSLN